ncbi:thermonuclease family protein [Chitinimonas lacunae]|uniref:Thermonuclease family protein n=1 Tax=Chitinimonas lacunae TaxID=1963018 RepID=A0ABV8MI43_9NEIS
MKPTRQQARAAGRVLSATTWPSRIAALLVLLSTLFAAYHIGREAPKEWPERSAESGQVKRGQVVEGEVVGVADGDTITVVDADKHQYKIRLAFVDAPEKTQPHGARAKQNLSDLVYGQAVKVEIEDVDRYQRAVGHIWRNGRDVNLAQLEAGYAWHYTQYAKKKQPEAEFERYRTAESQARRRQQGLWSDEKPTPPWEYRRAKREK